MFSAGTPHVVNGLPYHPYIHYSPSATPEPEEIPDSLLFKVYPITWEETWEPVFRAVLFYLDLEHVMRMRRVCKFLYYATHSRSLWASLLRRADPASLPPLAPVGEIGPLQDGVPEYLTALTIERILVRGASLRTNFSRACPRPFRIWTHETFAYMQDMVLLPGSEHLIAVQRNVRTKKCNIVLYKLDCHHDAEAMVSLPLAGEPIDGTLRAKYMTVGGVLGMTVVCVQKLLAEHSTPDGTPGATMAYECCAAHLCLDTMEKLAVVYPPDSPRYLWLSDTLPPASRGLVMPAPSVCPIRAPALGMLFGKPYAVYAVESGRNTSELWMQCLEGGKATVMPVAAPVLNDNFYDYMEWRIEALRVLPDQRHILVDSQYIFSTYGEPSNLSPAELMAHRIDILPVTLRKQPAITTPTPAPDVLIHYISATGHEVRIAEVQTPFPPQHSLYAASGLKPATTNHTTHVFAHAPLEETPRDADAVRPPTLRITQKDYHHVDFLTELNHNFAHPDAPRAGDEVRLLPGAQHPLLYKVLAVKPDPAREDAPPECVLSMHLYRGEDTGHPDNGLRGVVERLAWSGRDPTVGALAWDDTVGRLVVAHPMRTSFKVFDFAQMPKLDAHGDRWPIPLERVTENGPPRARLLRTPFEPYHRPGALRSVY